MLVLDTCAMILDALDPSKVGKKAFSAIAKADEQGQLACCDISLWEIAMLVAKGRLDPGTDALHFIDLVLAARKIEVLPITAAIAYKSALPDFCPHGDPADRLIAATAVLHRAKLATSDRKLNVVAGLQVVW